MSNAQLWLAIRDICDTVGAAAGAAADVCEILGEFCDRQIHRIDSRYVPDPGARVIDYELVDEGPGRPVSVNFVKPN